MMDKRQEYQSENAPPQPNYGQPQANSGQWQQPAYGQQPTVYAQPQPMYTGQVQYAQQPNVVVVNQVQPPVQTNWAMPRAKAPGIILIICGVFNLLVFIGIFAVWRAFYADILVAAILYLVTGILATIGGFKKVLSDQGIPISCIVMATITLVAAFVQVIIRGLGVTLGQNLMMDTRHYEFGEIVLAFSAILLITALLAFAINIALIVLGSKAVCSCCGGPQQSGGVIIQQPQMQQYPAQMQQPPA